MSEKDKQSYATLAAPATTSSSFLPPISQSQPYPYVDSREAQLVRSEEQGRSRIEKEQEMGLMTVRAQSRKAPQDIEGRCSTVKQRRLEQEKDTQAKLLEQQQADNEKAAVFAQMSKVFQTNNQERRKVFQEEHKMRVELQLEYAEGSSVLEKSYRGATRLQSTLDSLIQIEKRERREIAGEELSRRDALRATFATWKPAQRKAIAPLPPPPTNFQEAQRVYAEFYKQACPTKPKKSKEWEKPPPRSKRTIASIPMITTVFAKMVSGASSTQQQQHQTQGKKAEHQPRPPPPSGSQQAPPPRENRNTKPKSEPKKSVDEKKVEAKQNPSNRQSSEGRSTKTEDIVVNDEDAPPPAAATAAAGTSAPIEDDEYGEMSGSSSRNEGGAEEHSPVRSRSATPSEHYSSDEDHSPESARRESAAA